MSKIIINTTTQQQQSVNISNQTSTADIISSTKHEAGLISDETRDAIFAVYTWMMPTNSLLTIIFCVVNAAVYWQQRAATFAVYLIGVDLGDGLCAVVKLCSNVAYFTLPPTSLPRPLIDWYLAEFLATSFRRAGTSLNTLASLDRFLAIAFPLKNYHQHNNNSSGKAFQRPVVIAVCVFVASLAAHSFLAFEYHVVLGEDGHWRLTPTEWKLKNAEVVVTMETVSGIVFAYAPLTAVVVLNVLLVIMLRVHTASIKGVRAARGATPTDSGDVTKTSRVQRVPPAPCSFLSDGIPPKEKQDSQSHDEENARETDRAKVLLQSARPSSFSDDTNPGSDHLCNNENIPSQANKLSLTAIVNNDQNDHHHNHNHNPQNRRKLSNSENHILHHYHTASNSEVEAVTKTTSPPKHRDDTSVTRMVMLFTTVYFLLALPSMLCFTARSLLPEYGPGGREANLYQTVSTVSMLLSHLTEPCLFWVSFSYSRHFRRALFRLPFARWWCCGLRWLAVTSSGSATSSTSCDVSGSRSSSNRG
ncbi:uncharacterized protein LOC143275480 [Babylonia areolata]|uniref:uncharacterized protein LOC143275480 n=1 Tax=Babylonia areolata TaxID=304850 RepID=UPI003FCF286C